MLVGVLLLGGVLGLLLARAPGRAEPLSWTAKERRTIRSLSLAALPAAPRDPSNRFADSRAAAKLGRKFFFDHGFSANGQVSCSSCHMPKRSFQDGRPRGRGLGDTPRRTMPLAGVAYAKWLFWDGRRDSLWAQALTPLTSDVEHGITPAFAARRIASHYRHAYEQVFGAVPGDVNVVFANMGKAIAAYERTLRPVRGRFDAFAAALARSDSSTAARLFSASEGRGLKLFIGRARCTNCHFGPLLTNGEFHNTGVPQDRAYPDRGRADGLRLVRRDPFNCLGRYSDARPQQCATLRFLVTSGAQLAGQFKVPSLRGVAPRPPYMHAGQLRTLHDVLQHYNRGVPPHARVSTASSGRGTHSRSSASTRMRA